MQTKQPFWQHRGKMGCRRDLINEAKDSKQKKKQQEKKEKTGTKIKFQAAEVKLSLSKKVLVVHSILIEKQRFRVFQKIFAHFSQALSFLYAQLW